MVAVYYEKPCLAMVFLGNITSAIKHYNPDVGARRAVPRLGEASLAPTIDMFNCPGNNKDKNRPGYCESYPGLFLFRD
jgi:hypothetical protein